jgi:uncharacterized protein (DUF58 family)
LPLPSPPWDPEVLARIAALELRARGLVRGLQHGAHPSMRVTSNVEFADYKEYSPGDPLRDLDWRVLARSERLVVRRHRAEDELAITLVVDASADMSTAPPGGPRPPLDRGKWGAAAVLAATLAQWAARRNEPVGLSVLGGADVPWAWLPPAGGAAHLARVHAALASARPAGRAALGPGLEAVGARVRRRSLVVLISDLMEEPSEWGPAVDALGARGVDLRVLHVHDPREWRLEVGAAGRFRSPEGGDPLAADPDELRPGMAAVIDAYLLEVRGWLARGRGLHLLVPCDADLGGVLARALRMHS